MFRCQTIIDTDDDSAAILRQAPREHVGAVEVAFHESTAMGINHAGRITGSGCRRIDADRDVAVIQGQNSIFYFHVCRVRCRECLAIGCPCGALFFDGARRTGSCSGIEHGLHIRV